MKHYGMKKIIGILLACLLLTSCAQTVTEESAVSSRDDSSVYSDFSEESSEEIQVSLPEDISLEILPEESSEASEESEEIAPSLTVHPLLTEVSAKQAFIYDSLLDITFAKGDMEQRIYPASITKLYTAYVALQYLTPDTVITAGGELSFVGAGSTVAYISRGDCLTAEMLVQGMLLPSGNDAAYVLACTVSGS